MDRFFERLIAEFDKPVAEQNEQIIDLARRAIEERRLEREAAERQIEVRLLELKAEERRMAIEERRLEREDAERRMAREVRLLELRAEERRQNGLGELVHAGEGAPRPIDLLRTIASHQQLVQTRAVSSPASPILLERYGIFGINGLMESFSTCGGFRNFVKGEMTKLRITGFIKRTKKLEANFLVELDENQRPALDDFFSQAIDSGMFKDYILSHSVAKSKRDRAGFFIEEDASSRVTKGEHSPETWAKQSVSSTSSRENIRSPSPHSVSSGRATPLVI